jgi:hypothetical protein
MFSIMLMVAACSEKQPFAVPEVVKNIDALNGKTVTVGGYWKGTDEQKAQWQAVGNDRPYHYLGSGKTYYLKGQAFGEAVLKLMPK